MAANHGHFTHVFQPANLVAFVIKTSVQNGLKENHYDGRDTMSPHEHLSQFYKTCQFCVPPATVTEDQKKLRLFAKDNSKNESCNAIELRRKKVLTPLVPKASKKSEEVVVEDTGISVVENNTKEVVVEKENDNGVVENERKKKMMSEKKVSL